MDRHRRTRDAPVRNEHVAGVSRPRQDGCRHRGGGHAVRAQGASVAGRYPALMGGADMSSFDLKSYELSVNEICRNLPPSALYEHAIRYEKNASIAENGALVAYSGSKTGRSPKDKRVVKNPASEKEIWWGAVNIPLEPSAF